MATLAELLALLPDNDTGDIDAADLRTIVTELWNQGVAPSIANSAAIAADQAQAQAAYVALDTRISELEGNTSPPTLNATGHWQVNVQAGATPGGQQFTSDSGNLGTATTWLRFTKFDQSNDDFTPALMQAVSVYTQHQTNAANWVRFEVTGAATDAGSYVEIPVHRINSAGSVDAAAWQAAIVVLEVPYS